MDALLENHGTTWLVRPLTQVASDWIEGNVQEDAQFFGNALVVEHRFVGDLAEGMRADGLGVRA